MMNCIEAMISAPEESYMTRERKKMNEKLCVEDDLNGSSNNNEQNDSRNKGCKYKTARKKGKEKHTVSLKH